MTADERIVRTYRRECRDQEHFDGIEPVLVNHLHVDYTDRVQLEQALLTAPDNQPHISIRWRDGERDRETVHFDRIDRVVVAPGHVGIEQLRLSAEAGE